ncbi:hypothetical protein B0H12DRAFT_1236564 [Mycena haematopus]|nr:hypothetical protein B0H12DRAFT_1244456 [Mycena haematopus]KAJ7200460.1 hypothetical protein B0H12DRAFT_1244458 [Mycena haematopus]KAJ7243139.1 hypothetical protein B0H12DRAFT_1236564 [Mycena haematopus]
MSPAHSPYVSMPTRRATHCRIPGGHRDLLPSAIIDHSNVPCMNELAESSLEEYVSQVSAGAQERADTSRRTCIRLVLTSAVAAAALVPTAVSTVPVPALGSTARTAESTAMSPAVYARVPDA